MNSTSMFACQRFPTWIPKAFVCMSLHNFCKKIIGLLKFTHIALMNVFLSLNFFFNHVLNDKDVVCKSILLHSLKCFLLISPKWTHFEGVKHSIGNDSKIWGFSIGGHGKLNWQMAWFFFLQVFLWRCVWASQKLGVSLLLSYDIHVHKVFNCIIWIQTINWCICNL